MTALKERLIGYINVIPDSKLLAIQPLLLMLSNESIRLETDLTEEELRWIEEGEKQIAKGEYIDFEDYLRERGIEV